MLTGISKMTNFSILFVMFLGRYGVPLSKYKELLRGYFFPIELPFHIGVKKKRGGENVVNLTVNSSV